MKTIKILGLLLLACSAVQAQDAKQIVSDMVEAMGGKEKLYQLHNVSFHHKHHDPDSDLTIESDETYIFRNEQSYATYQKLSLFPDKKNVKDGFDGSNAWISFDGKPSQDEKALGIARFLRKTNYYFFTMFYKLFDKGVNLKYKGAETIDGKAYDLIQVTFGDKIGDVQDTYIYYINKKTKLVDRMLFTVMGFGLTEPKLMIFEEYQTINGIQLATKRKSGLSNWNGDILSKKMGSTLWTDIEFDQKISPEITQSEPPVAYYSDYFVFVAKDEKLVVPIDFNWSQTDGGYKTEFKSWYGTVKDWPIAYSVYDTEGSIPKDFADLAGSKHNTFNTENRNLTLNIAGAPKLEVLFPETSKWTALPEQLDNKELFAVQSSLKVDGRTVEGWMVHERIRWGEAYLKSFGDFKAFYWLPFAIDGDFYLFEQHSGVGEPLAFRWYDDKGQIKTESIPEFELKILETKKDAKSGRKDIPKVLNIKAPKWDIDITLESQGAQVGYGGKFAKGLGYYRQSIVVPTEDSKTKGYGMLELVLEDN